MLGYNSAKFDLRMMMKMIIRSLEKRKIIKPTFKSGLNMLKKSGAYFSIKFANLHFKDVMAFSAPMPLAKYLKTWTTTEVKQVKPPSYSGATQIFFSIFFYHYYGVSLIMPVVLIRFF